MLPSSSILPGEDDMSTSAAADGSVIMPTSMGDDISRSNATVAFHG